MCRIPKVLVVAPAGRHQELRRALSSLDYDIAATVEVGEAAGVSADVAVAWEPDPATIRALRSAGMKVVALGGPGGSDLDLDAADPGAFRTRVWELLRAV